MSLEQALADNTAAIKEQTAFLKALQAKGGTAAAAGKPAAGKPAAGKPKKPTLDTIKERFGGYLATEDKKLREKRKAEISAVIEHYGVAKISEIDEANWEEALAALDQLEAGETPDILADGDNSGDDALV